VHELVLGGVSSGKSAWAEARAARYPRVTYVATAEAGDAEMAERLRRHRARRPAHWRTREAGDDLPELLRAHRGAAHCLLVDGLGLWLARFVDDPARLEAAAAALPAALEAASGPVLLVSDEVGLGGVAAHPVARRFADHLGRLNQALAARCARVVLVAAGLPLFLKGEPS